MGHLEFPAHVCPVTAFSGTLGNPWARKRRHGNGISVYAGRSSTGQSACLSRRRPRVQVPPIPPEFPSLGVHALLILGLDEAALRFCVEPEFRRFPSRIKGFP